MILADFWQKMTKIGQIWKNRKVTKPSVIPLQIDPWLASNIVQVMSSERKCNSKILELEMISKPGI